MAGGGSYLRTFDSVEQSVDECTSLLGRKYISQGKVTLADIGAMYCPIGAANDPGGLNKHWIPGVAKYYKQITGEDYDPSMAGTGNGTGEEFNAGGSGGSGGGTLELVYTGAPSPPKRLPSIDYNIKFGTSIKKLDLSSIGRPKTSYSPYNFVKDEPIETEEEKKKREEDEKDNQVSSKSLVYESPNILTASTKSPNSMDWEIEYGESLGLSLNENEIVTTPDTFEGDYVWSFEEDGEMDSSMMTNASSASTYYEACYGIGTGEDRRKSEESDGEDDSKPLDSKYYSKRGIAYTEKDFTKEEIEKRQASIKSYDPIKPMCVDMMQYSCTGRMLRAFPTYLFLIADDGGNWIDGRKLWTNYYSYSPLISIKIHQTKHSPIQTAHIELSNLTGDLNKKSTSGSEYTSIEKDEDYNKFIRFVYSKTGLLLCSPKITQSAIDIKNKIVDSMNLRAGARIHVRLGYGPNPLNLPICFNGTVAEVGSENGEGLSLVAQSDGAELANQMIVTKDDDDTNNIFRYGSEASNVIGGILVERENKWTNLISDKWGECSKYGIEHFGIHLGFDRDDASKKEYDLLKNIYTATYNPVRFVNSNFLTDGEKNVNIFLSNKYPWEIFKSIEQTVPEFICQPMYHQFDSRLFFGLPWAEASYRYDFYKDGSINEQFKAFSQFHILTSMNNIIKNDIKTSSRDLITNAICVYSQGGNPKKTPTVYSDRNIDGHLQKTKVIDTTVSQDYFGPDGLYSLIGFAIGKNAAINTAISNLLDSWSKTYRGEVIVFGDASIKPCDYIYLEDYFTQMYGLCTVRETIHSFSLETGFVTSITPGLIANTTLNNSGAGNVTKSLLNLGISMAAGYKVRYLSIVNAIMFNKIIALSSTIKISGLAKKIPELSKVAGLGKDLYKAFRAGDFASNSKKVYDMSKTVITSAKSLTNIKNIGKIVKDIKLGITAASATTMHPAVVAASWVITTVLFDILLNALIEEFAYNHSVTLTPLIFRDQPFVSGTKNCSDTLIPGLGETEDNRKDEIVEKENEVSGSGSILEEALGVDINDNDDNNSDD